MAEKQTKLVDDRINEVRCKLYGLYFVSYYISEVHLGFRNIISAVIPYRKTAGSADPACLMILLAFLADDDVPTYLLYRGASPRKRWTEDGEGIEAELADLGPL